MTSGVAKRQHNTDAVRRVALVLEYDGAAYKGFQWQANVPTVQDEAEAAIWKFTGEKTRVRGASRTDTGVHAQGQVVDFLTHVSHPLDTFTPALNWYLPADIRVRGAYQVCQEFNSRKDADSRRYRYTLLNSSWPSALLRRSTHWVRANLNIGRMQEAAGYLPGIRDLSAFTVPLPPDRTPVRRVDRWEVWQDGDLVMIEAEASGFLPHQVRMTNGILVEVGLGKMPPEIVEEMLVDATGAQAHRPSLPAKGLCLMSVTYSPLLCDRTAQAPAAAGRAEQNLFETERT